jgi:hypothetical protein
MASRIIDLAEVRRERADIAQDAVTASTAYAPRVSERFHFWSGASGQRYVHTVYSLLDCPALPAANYVLVRRDASGLCHALSVGRASDEAPSLNLAQIRQHGANLGATEVHIHLLAGTSRQGKLVEFDLKSAVLGDCGAPSSRLRH